MNLVQRVCRISAVAAASVFVAFAAHSQEVTPEHLNAARQAIAAIKVTDPYDNILPQAAQALKLELIQQNPDLEELVVTIVDDKALALASRRSDLEREAALAYARIFTEADLTAMAAFYTSDAGKKLLTQGPIASREVVKAAEIWQRGISRDLAEEVGKQLQTEVAAREIKNPAPAEAPVPADAPAPAPKP